MGVFDPFGQTVDSTDKDYAALERRAYSLIESVFPSWTDRERVGFANILAREPCFVGDVIHYNLDGAAEEGHWGTVKLRQNCIALAKLIAYRLRGATAAYEAVTFRLASPAAGSVTFPPGTIVATQGANRVRHQTIAAAVLPAGATESPAVTAEHSASRSERFNASGKKDQEIVLTFTPYLDLTASVSDAIGAFARVENFALSGPTDAHYMEGTDDDGVCTLRFGNGTMGRLPSGLIYVDYKTGGGEDGRVEAGQLTVVEGAFLDALGNPVRPTAWNASASAGGLPRETVAAARLLAPATIRVRGVTCCEEDFVINALRVAGVARALALGSEDDAAIPEGAVRLYLVPTGGGQPNEALLAAVRAIIGRDPPANPADPWFPHTMDCEPEVMAVTAYRTVDVAATVYLRPVPAGSTAAAHRVAARAEILAALTALLAPLLLDGSPNPYVDFGYNYRDINGAAAGELPLSDALNAVRDATRVRKVGARDDEFTLNGAHADVTVSYHEFPALGALALVDGDTGEAF